MRQFWESWGKEGERRHITRMHRAVSAKGNGDKTHIAVIEQVTGYQGDQPRFGTPEYNFYHGRSAEHCYTVNRTLCGLEGSPYEGHGELCKRCERRAEQFHIDEAFGVAPKPNYGIDDLVSRVSAAAGNVPITINVTVSR